MSKTQRMATFLKKLQEIVLKGNWGNEPQLSRRYMKAEESISNVCLTLPVMNLAVRVEVS